MAFSDFDFNGTQTTFAHSSPPLNTNPLTNGGAFCRRFTGSETGKMYYKTTAYGGAFFNVPNTKVVSCRACLRAGGTNAIGIVAKDGKTFSSSLRGGYQLIINGGGGKVQLVSNNGTVLIDSGVFGSLSTLWLSLRMDVFPISSTADRILCYMEVASSGSSTSSPGSGIWNNVIGGVTFDTTVSSTSGDYAPWLNSGRFGICGGWGASNSEIYVDNLNFSTYTAPT